MGARSPRGPSSDLSLPSSHGGIISIMETVGSNRMAGRFVHSIHFKTMTGKCIKQHNEYKHAYY